MYIIEKIWKKHTDCNLHQRKESQDNSNVGATTKNCSRKTWHMYIEIVFNGNTKKGFRFSVLVKGKINYIVFWYRNFLARLDRLVWEK